MLWRLVKLLLLAVLGFIALTAVYAKLSNAWFVIPIAGVVGLWLYRRSTALPVVQFVATPPSMSPSAVVAEPPTARKRGQFTPEEVAQHKAERREHWAQRLPQMLAAADVCPYWQFQVVGDAADPPACRAVDGHIARFDSEFWQAHNPAKCRRQMCRCTIRVYSQRQFEAKGLSLSAALTVPNIPTIGSPDGPRNPLDP